MFSQSRAEARNRQSRQDGQKDMKECVPIYDNDGNLLHILNTKNGKLEEPKKTEKLGFDPKTGKLGVITVVEGIDTDYQIQLGMAEDGFFIDLVF